MVPKNRFIHNPHEGFWERVPNDRKDRMIQVINFFNYFLSFLSLYRSYHFFFARPKLRAPCLGLIDGAPARPCAPS